MKVGFTVLSVLFSLLVSAQTIVVNSKTELEKIMYDNSYNFYEVVDAGEAFFNSIDKNAKGSGYKPFMRWVNANEYKYYPNGNRANVNPYFAQDEFKKFIKSGPNQKSLFGSDWRDLGPYTLDSITGHYSAGLGRVECLYVSPVDTNIMYLGSRSGGFWRTIDGGATWNVTTDFLFASGVNTMTVSPTNSDSVLINVRNATNATSHGVYESSDGGLTWSATGLSPATNGQLGLGNNFQIDEIAYHPRIKDLVFVGTNNGLFKSTDNLATWSVSQVNFDFIEIAFHPSNDSILYLYADGGAGVANNIFISNDLGATWVFSNTIPGNNGDTRVELATSPQCDDCIWFASNNGVWISTDQGVNFSFKSNSPESCGGFAVNDLDSSNMAYGYLDLDNSTNGGSTFVRRTRWSLGSTNGNTSSNSTSYATSSNYIHADVRDLVALNGNFYAATDGFLCKSTDGGVNWTILSEGTGIRENYKLGVSQSNQYRTIAGSQDNGTSILTERGWVEMYGADGMESLIHPLNENWMMGSVQFGNRRLTKDGGSTSSSASPSGSSSAYWEAPLAYDPNNHMRIFDFRDAVWKSDDFTTNYTQLGNPGTISGDIWHAEIAQNNSDIMIVSRGSAIEKSTDGGATFSSIKNNLPNSSVLDIAFHPKNDDIIIVVYATYQADNSKVWMTSNGGASWTNITYNLGSMPIRSVVIDHTNASNIYLGAEIGVYTMPMGSTNWSLYNSGLPNMTVKELEIVYGTNTLRAATWGRGLWEYSLVGRNSYPSIVYTTISNPPTENNPKANVDQYVTSKIKYPAALSSVYVEWSRDTAVFGNVIPMTNTIDSTWVSNNPLPNFAAATKVYFKVFAVGNNNDTTETYKFMYTVKPFQSCIATGNSSAANLFIDNVTIENLNNTTGNTAYAVYASPVLDLYVDSTYTLNLSANTSWNSNDYGAWIDFNGDIDFDLSERILFDPNSGGGSTANFTVPASAKVGDTVTLRVRLSYWGSEPLPCGNEFGEVEDYRVKLSSAAIATTRDTIQQTACQSFYWDKSDEQYTTSGNYFDTIPNAAGGDSIIRLELTINTAQTNPLGAQTWYINNTTGSDSNNGQSLGTAFRTVEHAMNNAVMAGDTILIVGEYKNENYGDNDIWKTENTFKINNFCGDASNYLTVRAYDDNTILKGDGQSIVRITNSAYLKVENFEVAGEVDSIPLDSSLYYQFTYMDNNGVVQQRVPRGTSDAVIAGMTFSRLNGISRPQYFDTKGIYASKVHHLDVTGSTIHHMPGTGLRVAEGDYVNLIDNEIHNCSRRSYSGTHALVVHSAKSIDKVTSYKFNILRNKVHHNYNELYSWSPSKTIITPHIDEGKGISLQKNAAASSGWIYGRFLVSDNLVYWNGFSGVHNNSGERMDFVNNTCYYNSYTGTVTQAGAGSGRNIGISTAGGSDIKIINNIIVADTDWNGFTISIANTSNVVVSDNLAYGLLDPDVDAIDVRTENQSPEFIDPANFNFSISKNSFARDTANTGFSSSSDYYEFTRDSKPDLGAVEFDTIAVSIAITNDTPCKNDTTFYTFTGDEADSLVWRFVNGVDTTFSREVSDTLLANVSGNYDLKLLGYSRGIPSQLDSVTAVEVIETTSAIDVQTACDSYTWIDGNTYTASNSTATHTLTNAAGCDSVVTLNLTLNSSTAPSGGEPCGLGHPGSGMTLTFDGIDDFIQLDANLSIGNSSHTAEMWVKIPTVGTENLVTAERVGILLGNYNAASNFNYEIHSSGQCRVYWNGGEIDAFGTTDLRDNVWHHITFVRDKVLDEFRVYVDGIEEFTEPSSGTDLTLNGIHRIGGDNRTSGGPSFHGKIDELRIWDDSRTEAEIRDFMCQKLKGAESDLLHYYRIDDATGTRVIDEKNGLNGTLTNMSANDWVISGAPIGDTSTHLYNVNALSADLNIFHNSGDSMTIEVTDGSAQSIHLYRVNQEANNMTTPNTLNSIYNSNYYGAKSFGSAGLVYSSIYHYSNQPNITDPSNLVIAKRSHNGDTVWTREAITLSLPDKTLTLTGQTGTEFVLAESSEGSGPLPITLLYFQAELMSQSFVELSWSTLAEINNDYFVIERSENGKQWEDIDTLKGAENSTQVNNYKTIDANPIRGVAYYRLRQVDFDGTQEHFNVEVVDFNVTNTNSKIYPNPTNGEKLFLQIGNLGKEGCVISIYSKDGKLLKEKEFNTGNELANHNLLEGLTLSCGIYYIKLNGAFENETIKVVVF